jgi:hypothetical protein
MNLPTRQRGGPGECGHAHPQFGLVAEQVAKVDPELVARDHNGQPYTAVNRFEERSGFWK